MVNKEIFKIADQLQGVVQEQMEQAKQALSNLPEGRTKKSLEDLLKRASTGKVSHVDAQREVQKIIKNASTN